MKLQNFEQVEETSVELPGATGCKMRLLVSDKDGAPTFAMRQFAVEPSGHTPLHSHDYEHEVYVLSGSGIAVEGTVEHPIQRGDVLFVEPNEIHQFKNNGSEPLEFICLIPNSAAGKAVTLAPNGAC
ncbi:MAG: cupin domain-containing protein [Pirellulaceae bacterium]|nr:cupin domain-containing protein [Pirellulaceae bacterium]